MEKYQENIKLVQNLIKEDRQITNDVVANQVKISNGSSFAILTEELGLSKLTIFWVTKTLREDQLTRRADFF